MVMVGHLGNTLKILGFLFLSFFSFKLKVKSNRFLEMNGLESLFQREHRPYV